jgi:lantibiotic biosynthesis protein
MSLHASRYVAADFFVLRTPVLPMAFAEQLLVRDEGGEPSEPSPAAAPERAPSEPEHQIIELLLRTTEAVEAVYIAAPEFLELLQGGAQSGWRRDRRKYLRAVETCRRYLIRMAHRPTPFGLFAGCSWGPIGDVTNLQVPPAAATRRHVRLDAQVLYGLCSLLLADTDLLLSLPVTPNSTLYQVGAEWRFIERHTDGSHEYSFALGAIEKTPLLDSIIERSRGGMPGRSHAEYVCRQGYSDPDARAYIESLIHSQVLVSALVPSVVGQDSLTRLRDLIVAMAPGCRWTNLVNDICEKLEDLNATQANGGIDKYRRVEHAIEAAGVQLSPGRTLHADLYRDGPRPTLSRKLTERVLGGVSALLALSTQSTRQQFLATLREAFNRRYGDRDVPLLHLFDPTIGFSAPLVSNAGIVAFEAAGQLAEIRYRPAQTLSPAQGFLLNRLGRASAEGSHEITVEVEDVVNLSALNVQSLPDTFAVLVSLFSDGLATRQQDGKGILIHLRGLVGGSPASLVGRFLHGDAPLREKVEALLATEQRRRPDTILAELNFASGPRSPNVSRRPHLREFEIPVIGPRDPAHGTALDLSDLFVRIENGRFTLWSERLGRRVMPRLSSMHGVNPQRDLALYAFLLALQGEDGIDYAGQESLWGPLWEHPWLPRVLGGDVILSRETWLLIPSEIAGPPNGALDRVRSILTRRSIPHQVVLTEGDYELPLDLDTEWSLKTIVTALRTGPVRLQEALAASFTPVVEGPDGYYNSELVIPYLSSDEHASHRLSRSRALPLGKHLYSSRRFPPGTAWLYLKVYVPPPATNWALTAIIGPTCRRLIRDGSIDKWFFLRYADSSEHLRLRLHCAAAEWDAVYQCVADALVEAANVTDVHIEIGTYEPETRRYGGQPAMLLTETLFHLDSELALDLLSAVDKRQSAKSQFLGNVAALDQLLGSLQFDQGEREELVQHALDLYSSRSPTGVTRSVETVCGNLHRDIGVELRGRLINTDPGSQTAAVPSVGDQWFGAISALASQVREAISADGVAQLEDWAVDVLHMHCNRVFESHIMEQEYLAYAMLSRQYRGMRGRQARSEITP